MPGWYWVLFYPTFRLSINFSNSQRAGWLRALAHERVPLIMVGLFTADATIKIKHLGKRSSFEWKNTHLSGNSSRRQNSCFEGRRAKKIHKSQPESAF